jgi:hypothetical protein
LAKQLLGQMEPNLAGSIYVRSSLKFLHFVLFGQQIWLPRAILVSDWLQNCSWRPCLLAEGNQMKKLYRRSYIDASYQVGLIWPSSFRGEDLFNISQSETRIDKHGRQEQFFFLIGYY